MITFFYQFIIVPESATKQAQTCIKQSTKKETCLLDFFRGPHCKRENQKENKNKGRHE